MSFFRSEVNLEDMDIKHMEEEILRLKRQLSELATEETELEEGEVVEEVVEEVGVLAEGEVLDEGGAPDEGGEEVVVVWYHQLRRKNK